MTTWYGLSEFRKAVYDHQDARVPTLRWAEFLVIKLYQLIEILALDIIQVEPDVPRFITHLLAREAFVYLHSYTAANTGPCVTLVNACDNFGDALMSHGFMSTKLILMLVESWHHNHARMLVQWTLRGGYCTQRTPFFLLNVFFA